MRELGVSALLELTRDKVGIAEESERHSKPETSPPRPAGEDKSSCSVCRTIGVSGDSEVDETSPTLEIARSDVYRIITWSGSVTNALEADEACAQLEIAAEDVFVIIADSKGDSKKGSKAAEGFAVSFNEGCSENPIKSIKNGGQQKT